MEDYYEILGLNAEASKEDIKKAYFKLVRKYPPDRYETQFMDIRKAYETLSNEKTRKQYDLVNYLSTDIKYEYNSASTLLKEGDLTGAIRILEKILESDPGILIVKSLLAEAYLKNRNSGKALEMYKELTSEEPKNAAFAGYLANAYLMRGWQKKAIVAYNRAIELDSDNISLWMGLGDAHIKNEEYLEAKRVLEKALDVVGDISDNTIIYFKLIMLDIESESMSSMYKYLDKLTEVALNNNEIKDNVAWSLSHIAKYLMCVDNLEEAKSIIDRAAEILPKDKDIECTKIDIDNFKKYEDIFSELDMDDKIKDQVVGLVAFKIMPNMILGIEDDRKEVMTYFYEYEILENYSNYQSSIQKLKKDYPELYIVREDFFNKAISSTERKKLKLDYRKKLNKYKNVMGDIFDIEEDEDEYEEFENWYDDNEYQEPYVRKEPKIGRNDPCPCGSGKKYKNCCGK